MTFASPIQRCSAQTLVLGIALAAYAPLASADFDYPDFSSVAGLTFNGDAAQAGIVLRVTPDAEGQRGSVWYTATKQHVLDGFDTTFGFRMTGGMSGDGMAFVIQDAGPTALGGGGSDLGYGGIVRSIAIEIDTFGFFPETDNHISVQTRGAGPNSSEDQYSLVQVNVQTNLNDGQRHDLLIRYRPGVLLVFLDGSDVPTIDIALDLQNIGGGNILDGSGDAWVGFTAGTGLATENHDVEFWSFDEAAFPIPSGPCCTLGGCVIATPHACKTQLNGFFAGPFNGDCGSTVCTGACCTGDSCEDSITLTDCTNNGGKFMGVHVPCNYPDFPTCTGACCDPDGVCFITSQSDCEANHSGTYHGSGTSCAPFPCALPPNGSCCVTNECLQMTESDCANAPGIWYGVGTNCLDVNCFDPPPSLGACCQPGNTCVDSVTATACTHFNGVYQGDASLCMNSDCSNIIYSNLAVDPFGTGHAWVIAGSDWGYNGFASKFSPSGDYSVFQIDVAVSVDSGTPTMIVGLYSDNGGLPGTLISGPHTVAIPDCCTLASITVNPPVRVCNGQTYWVGVLPGAADTSASWNQNPDLGQTVAYSPDGSTWYDSGWGSGAYPGEFDVLGTPGSGPGSCDCQNATPIDSGAFFSDSTIGAPSSPGPTCADASPAKIYAFTPTEGGLGLINTCNYVNFDSVISVHTGCPLTAENEIACDHGSCDLGAQVTFCAVAGQTYYIRVGGVAGASGDYYLLALAIGVGILEGPYQNPANGHWYYSTDYGPWTAIEPLAVSKGGHLVTINDSAENEWVRSMLASGSGPVAIGINDAASEGTFVWTSGEPVTYTNWQAGQPDNASNNEDYGVMMSDGEWLDQNDCVGGNNGGIIEVDSLVLPGVLAGPISNPSNCHDYYLTQPGTWIETQLKAQSLGGNLVSIDNAAENEFVRATFANFGAYPQAVWIGLTDRDIEGTFVWVDGNPATYTNWNPGEPNNLGNEDYVTMNDPVTGGWNDAHSGVPWSGVIEIATQHCLLGDMNCDDTIDTADIPFFVQALLQSGGFGGCNVNLADMNGDGLINGLDAQAFVAALLNG